MKRLPEIKKVCSALVLCAPVWAPALALAQQQQPFEHIGSPAQQFAQSPGQTPLQKSAKKSAPKSPPKSPFGPSPGPGSGQSTVWTKTPAQTEPSGPIATYEYNNDAIYEVRTGLGITTEIELSPNEKILDYSAGFASGWDLSRRGNVFYIKPKGVDVDTNMVIRTQTHSYIFELKVVATDWRSLREARNAGVQYQIHFSYPADAAFASEKAKAPPPSEQSAQLLKDRSYNFNYDYSTSSKDASWLIPANVYDDGRFTYIKMPDLKEFPTGNFPTVYMRNAPHSQDSLINTTVEGNTIIVHGTYNYLILRYNNKIVALRRNTRL